MINVYCRKVRKKFRGRMERFAYHWDRRKSIRRKIPENAIYRTHNGHHPREARGCGPDIIDNYVYWNKKLEPLLNIRVENHMTWSHAESVPKGVVTQHKNALIKWLEEK